MPDELRELLLNVLRSSVQLTFIADDYETTYLDLYVKMNDAASAMREVASELETILGADDDTYSTWDDLTLLDDPANMDWDDAQYEPFTL